MHMIQRAIWFIEAHLGEPLTLDQIAEAVGATRFALAQVFAATTGMTTLGYVRARRLSLAARALAAGAPDILELALEAGYGSHEAFSRAFRERFGENPAAARERRAVPDHLIQEVFSMTKAPVTDLPTPRYEDLPSLTIAGISEPYATLPERARIPGQWQRFLPHIGHDLKPLVRTTFGVSYDFDPAAESFSYLCAVQVAPGAGAPKDIASLALPAQRYAVFRHTGHVSEVGATMNAIFNVWAPGSGHVFADLPACMERYGSEFDGRTGFGGFDILVPVKA